MPTGVKDDDADSDSVSASAAGATPSPSRRTMRITPKHKNSPGRKNFALQKQLSLPPHDGFDETCATSTTTTTTTTATSLPTPSGLGKIIIPRNRQTFMREKNYNENVHVSQQDSDGAVAKHAKMLFQSQPCLLQMINSGEVTYVYTTTRTTTTTSTVATTIIS